MHRQAIPTPFPPLLHDRKHIIHTVLCFPLFIFFFLLKPVSGGSLLIPSHSCLVSPVWILSFPRPPALMTQGTAVPLHPFPRRPCRTCFPERGLQWRVPLPGPHCPLPGGAGPRGLGLLLLMAWRPALGLFLPFGPIRPAGAAGFWRADSPPPSCLGYTWRFQDRDIWRCSLLPNGMFGL